MAQQQIITKPYVGELQDDDSLFINHDGALRQVKKKDTDFASSEYVRTYVDNATVASAQKATNDSDGNAINTTYRKVADSYNKSEIDTKLTGKADKATTLSGYGITDGVTKGELNTATVASARNATNATNATNDADGNTIKTTYRKVADSYTKSEVDTAVNGKVNKSGDTMTGKLTAPKIETGTDEANYFQSKKFRGQGDASTYYHAVDFGYANHDMVDFHEYGGVWNFYQNTEGQSNTGSLVASIQPDGVHAPLKGNADTATSATKATQDSDGNAINTTYRKVSDSYSKSEIDTKLTGKANKATSLSGYGITDSYNKSEMNTKLNGKADKATSLSGYGITDGASRKSHGQQLRLQQVHGATNKQRYQLVALLQVMQ